MEAMDQQWGSGPRPAQGTLPWFGHQSIDAPAIPRFERLAQEEFFREMARLPGGFFGLVEPVTVALGRSEVPTHPGTGAGGSGIGSKVLCWPFL